MIENFKQSNRYKKTLRVLFLDNLENIKSNFIELNNHYNFDLNTNISEVKENLRMHISKKLTPVIPKNFNVLVLDNSPEMLEIISIHLNDLGHSKFDLCHSILESKEKLSKKEYDLLLLDWNLDDGTCIDLIEFIHDETQSERTRSAVVVVITGRDDVDDIMTLLRYGVKNHIIKPFGFNEFEEKVSYAIEIHMRKNI